MTRSRTTEIDIVDDNSGIPVRDQASSNANAIEVYRALRFMMHMRNAGLGLRALN